MKLLNIRSYMNLLPNHNSLIEDVGQIKSYFVEYKIQEIWKRFNKEP